MGRRKIEIQPLTDERNRTVTFIKRKAGLLKKAHELAVLCQVDVTVLIVGPNNTMYEFSSVEPHDLIDHYLHDQTMTRDIKGPSDFGNYTRTKTVSAENLKIDGEKPSMPHQQTYDHINKKRRLSGTNNTSVNNTYMSRNDSEGSDSNENISMSTTANNTTTNIVTENNSSNTNIHGATTRPNTRGGEAGYLSTSFRESSDRDHKVPAVKNEVPVFNSLQDHVQNQIKGYGMLSAAGNVPVRQINVPDTAMQSIRNNSAAESNENNVSDRPTEKSSVDPLHTGVTSTKPDEHINSLSPIVEHQLPSHTATTSIGSVASSHDGEKPKKPNMRPVLRVEIPNNNVISNNAIQSEPSSSTGPANTANIYGGNRNMQYMRKTNNEGKTLGPINTKGDSPLSAGPNSSLALEKNSDGKVVLKAPNSTTFSFSNGLPPLFSSTSAVPPYVATPLQASGNASSNNGPMNFAGNNSSSPIQAQLLPNQKQLPLNQGQRYGQQIPFNPPQLGTGRIFSPTNGLGNVTKLGGQDHMLNGPPTGSLPSKFANDLMMPSPNGSISMFQDWSLGSSNHPSNNPHIGSATNNGAMNNNIPMMPSNNNTNANTSFPGTGNGNTGLTPYINVGQTPLANKFFNFSNDVGGLNDESGATNNIKELKRDEQ